ncbi:hypothetical protein C8J56DRAFT_925766 [Mycena floridula]|nr:hypothetical protein C8J56DRAFT_925766 [Mycena floridula]
MTMAREMSRHQLGLADVCFEEGQYDSGIAVLDQLRSPDLNPSAAHIRQLLYISLHPPYKGKDKPHFDPTVSPSKMNKPQKTLLTVSGETIAAAQRLLLAFASTNSPDIVFRTIPQQPATGASRPSAEDGEEDSVIAFESLCITRAKNCWSILEDRFIERTLAVKPKGRKSRNHQEDDNEESEPDLPGAIDSSVWPVLEWLLVIFERDESLTMIENTPQHSPLLLTQIPVARDKVARWELKAPLDIVFYCLAQTDERRRTMGGRLMTLLINLSSTIYLDYPLFLTSVFTRLASLTSLQLSNFFGTLRNSAAVLKFKIALCQKFIVTTSATIAPVVRPRPKAHARPPPKAVRAGEPSNLKPESVVETSIARKHNVPSSAEILRITQLDIPSTADDSHLRLRLELLISYGTYQAQCEPGEKDPEWPTLMKNGQVLGSFPTTNDESCDSYKATLNTLISVW